jgi:hypothetical protein
MKPLDFAKAAGVALLVLAIDLLIAVGVVFVWGMSFEPGHPQSYYQTAGVPIARSSTRIAGTALIFGAAWLFARRRPQRNGLLFAAALVFFYALLDGASAGFVGFFSLSMALTLLLKLAAALSGAFLAHRTRVAP